MGIMLSLARWIILIDLWYNSESMSMVMFYIVKNKAEVFMSSVLTAIGLFKNQFSIICGHISEFSTLLK